MNKIRITQKMTTKKKRITHISNRPMPEVLFFLDNLIRSTNKPVALVKFPSGETVRKK